MQFIYWSRKTSRQPILRPLEQSSEQVGKYVKIFNVRNKQIHGNLRWKTKIKLLPRRSNLYFASLIQSWTLNSLTDLKLEGLCQGSSKFKRISCVSSIKKNPLHLSICSFVLRWCNLLKGAVISGTFSSAVLFNFIVLISLSLQKIQYKNMQMPLC